MTPIQEIHAERKRQIDVEGWTAEHDDQHADGEMLTAATLYYAHALGRWPMMRDDGAPLGWPWDAQWWKPKDRHRDLVRAGALCLAERERIRRLFERRFNMECSPEVLQRKPFTGHVDHKLGLIVSALTTAYPGEKS